MPEDLTKMSAEQLAIAYRVTMESRPHNEQAAIVAELRRRDEERATEREAVKRLVEAGNRVREWMQANGYRDDDESFGLRAALAEFKEQ